MGEIVHKLIKDKKISAAAVAKAVSMSKSNVYKIYSRRVLDIDKMLNLSEVLGVNLFDYYYKDDRLKKVSNSLLYNLEQSLEEKTKQLASAEAEIARLNRENSHQSKLLIMMEEKVNYLIEKQEKDQNKQK
jgi:transcriptional regulator with XRE-family HTH domain